MKLTFLSVFLQLPSNFPETFTYSAYHGRTEVNLEEPTLPLGVAVEAGVLGFSGGSLALGLSSDFGYYTTDQVWPFRAVVNRTALDVGIRWDLCRPKEPSGLCFWYDLMSGPRVWALAPTDWTGGANYGAGLRTGAGLTFSKWKVRPTVGAELGLDLGWGSRSGYMDLPDRSGNWNFEPGGFHGDFRVGVEI